MAGKRNNRRADLAMIHMAKKALGYEHDDVGYRAILLQITGKDSSGDMNIAERSKVLARFKELGWQPKRKRWSKGHTYHAATSKYIIVLWGKLFDAGKVEDKSLKAMTTWLNIQFGKRNPDWLEDYEASQAIEQLKKWLGRD